MLITREIQTLDATRQSQKLHQLYIVVDFKKLITNLLNYFRCRTADRQVIRSAASSHHASANYQKRSNVYRYRQMMDSSQRHCT